MGRCGLNTHFINYHVVFIPLQKSWADMKNNIPEADGVFSNSKPTSREQTDLQAYILVRTTEVNVATGQ